MGLRCVVGDHAALKARLPEELQAALCEEGAQLIVLVPEQYTLQAELDIVDALAVDGFFSLQIMSPARLYSRIFEQAGHPPQMRIDERGRVMLLHAALKKLRKSLRWYEGAQHRSGFAQWMMQAIAELKQAHLTPESAQELAQSLAEGTLKHKLSDLAQIWTLYEETLAGRFLDGEDERARALSLAERVDFLRGARIWAYGFEMASPALSDALVALCPIAREVTLMLTMNRDPQARDAAIYEPVARSLGRLMRLAQERGIPVERVPLPTPPPHPGRPDMAFLRQELYCLPWRAYEDAPSSIRLVCLSSPREEAMFAAALARDLVMRRGWRYRDIAIICQNMEQYASVLERACDLYEVPLFMESSRPAGRHPLAQYLLLSLKLVAQGWQEEDVRTLMQTGYTGLADGEIDRLSNYAIAHGLRGNGWKRPLSRGGAELIAQLEPIRARLTMPLLAFEQALRAASDTRAQMSALWDLMTAIRAAETLQTERERLASLGLLNYENESAQVFNRIVGALDQMVALLGDVQLPVRDVYEMLSQSLMASEIKLLPQSSDSLTAGSLNRLRTQPLKALILLGSYDAGPIASEGLFESRERQDLRALDLWLGPDAQSMRALSAVDIKSALSQTSDHLIVSYPHSDDEGQALQSGALPMWLARLFPRLSERGGLRADLNMQRIFLGARDAALARLAPSLSNLALDPIEAAVLRALNELPEGRASIGRMREALAYRSFSDDLPPELAKRLYDGPRALSVTRLEQFAACPFRHFAQYGLRPEIVVPYEVTAQDEGSFFHQAMEEFFRAADRSPGELPEAEVFRTIDGITERLLARAMDGPLGDSPVMRFEGRRLRDTARRAAQTACRHFQNSRFEPCAIEVNFGEGSLAVSLKAGDDLIPLRGRIDRIDHWADADETWLRIVDYKSGQADVNLVRLYFGLQVQLILYLAVAVELDGCRPAGAFYFKIADPTLDTDERDPKKVERLRQDALRLSGLYVRDPRVLEAIAPDAQEVVRLRVKKDGALAAAPGALEASDFELLMRYAMKSAEKMAELIRGGVTAIAPAKLGNYLACDLCDLRALCLYDARLGASPRQLPAMRSAQVLDRVKESLPASE